MNTFDLAAEQLAVIGKYGPVKCKCGWKGTQAQLKIAETKNRACPECLAAFVRGVDDLDKS